MAQGKKSGCLLNGFIVLLVFIGAAVCFYVGALYEGATGAVSASLGDSMPKLQPAEEQEAQPEEQAGTDEASGTILYDGEDMKVTYLGLEQVAGMEAANLLLEVENKTSATAWVSPDQQTSIVNGYNVMLTQGAPTYINPGNKGRVALILNYQQFGASSVDDIESVSMDIQLISEESASDVLASAPISMTF